MLPLGSGVVCGLGVPVLLAVDVGGMVGVDPSGVGSSVGVAASVGGAVVDGGVAVIVTVGVLVGGEGSVGVLVGVFSGMLVDVDVGSAGGI